MVCCRLGHNEQDDPVTTLPLSYTAIAAHPPVLQLYGQQLQAEGILDQDQSDAWQVSLAGRYEAAQAPVQHCNTLLFNCFAPNCIDFQHWHVKGLCMLFTPCNDCHHENGKGWSLTHICCILLLLHCRCMTASWAQASWRLSSGDTPNPVSSSHVLVNHVVAAMQATSRQHYDKDYEAYKAGKYKETAQTWLSSSWQGDALQVRNRKQ